MLHGHGDDGYRYHNPIVADFSTNVWYGGTPEGLKQHLFKNWQVVERYPEVLAESLGKKIALHHQCDPEQVLICNGATDSIYLIAQAFRNNKTTIVVPAFAEYEDAGRLHGHHVEFVDWGKLPTIPRINSNLCYICNPNNPTGFVFSELELLIQKNPHTIFIIDEAFIEFTLSVKTAIPLLNRFSNLIILRSMTKAYSIPGLRLGYIIASVEMIKKLKEWKFPWSVNALAVEAGKFIFDHFQNVQVPLQQLMQEKELLFNRINEIDNIKLQPSHTHFMLGELLYGTADALKEYLIEEHGLLIRDASNFRGLSEKHFRICTLSPSNNQLLIEALKQWKKVH